MLEFYDSGYYLIGPYFPNKVHGEFEEKVPPDMLKAPFDALKNDGIHCHFGTWLVPGNPNTVLIDFAGFVYKKDELKTTLWESYQIDSMGTEFFDYDESVVWCAAVGRLLQELSRTYPNKKIVAHFHEWLAGSALLFLKSSQVPVATVFTTHATMLGRTLSGNDIDLYSRLESFDADVEAKKFKITAKHLTERQCAQQADVFTTVSEITGMEAQSFFGRAPDILVHNGLDVSKFPTFEESTIRHRLFKSRIQEFLLYYFFPYYSFDTEEALFYFVCGRYEFHAKGIDVLIKSLGVLNSQLRKEKQKTTVVCFFWIPGNIRGIKPSLLESKTFFTDVKDSVYGGNQAQASAVCRCREESGPHHTLRPFSA
jgi:glycogen(starch) synthase